MSHAILHTLDHFLKPSTQTHRNPMIIKTIEIAKEKSCHPHDLEPQKEG
jgi:hypothetical protein